MVREGERDRQIGGGKRKRINHDFFTDVCLVGFLTSSSTTRLYLGRAPRLTSDNFTCCHT